LTARETVLSGQPAERIHHTVYPGIREEARDHTNAPMNVAAACRRAGIFQRSLGTDGAKGRGLSPLFRPASGFPSLGASGAIRIHHWVKAELHQDLPVEDR
jgi:hypothetical protein